MTRCEWGDEVRECQEFKTATERCGKLAVISELKNLKRDLCAECARRLWLREQDKKIQGFAIKRYP
jgi:hypothetical protein